MSGLARLAAGALLSGALLPLLAPAPATAVVVQGYDVSVLTLSHASQSSAFALPPLGQMPWWGNSNLASTFAYEVFNQLGAGWDAAYGPVFAYAIDNQALPVPTVLGLTQSLTDLNDQIDVTPSLTATTRYAIAVAPVPLPLPLLGAAAGLGWSRRLRQRTRLVTQEAFHAMTTTQGRPSR
jgi:hypothetical protein